MNLWLINLVFILGIFCCFNLDEVFDIYCILVGLNLLILVNNDVNQNFGNEDFSFKIDFSYKMEYNIFVNVVGVKCIYFLKFLVM